MRDPVPSHPTPLPTPRRPRTHRLAAVALALLVACASSNDELPMFEEVPPAEDLYAEGMQILEGVNILWIYRWVNYQKAIERFQTVIDNYPYSDIAVQAELRIADSYFADGRWDEALSYYRDFADLHPNHEKVPYTMLQAALCHNAQVESPNRDQTPTREALEALEKLIRRFPYSPETREGEELMRDLRARLARSIMDVGDFYLDRRDYQAAAARYRSVLDGYPGLGLDAEALYKLGVSYENMQRNDEALRLFLVIVENFRDSDIADQAADHIAAAN
ncbi:MAG: outer membrane protein assembly factor BamD [Myxococcota bacterium]